MFEITKSVSQNMMYLASWSQLFCHKNQITVVREGFAYCLLNALVVRIKAEVLSLSESSSHRASDGTMSVPHVFTFILYIYYSQHDRPYPCPVTWYVYVNARHTVSKYSAHFLLWYFPKPSVSELLYDQLWIPPHHSQCHFCMCRHGRGALWKCKTGSRHWLTCRVGLLLTQNA